MADAGTLATSAQVLLAIGANASATQILEANTNYWILYAESEIYMISERDFVGSYASVTAAGKQYLASIAAARAAMHGINQNQNQWGLASTQSKLNVLNDIWQAGIKILTNKDKIALWGL